MSEPQREHVGGIAIRRWGSGPPIVCVHGAPGTGADFEALAALLARSYTVIAPDLPGYGDTPLAAGPAPSPGARSELLLELIDALGLGPVILVGHSFGGVIALGAAARAPQRVRGLVLLASPGLRRHRMSVPPLTAWAIWLLLRWPLTTWGAPLLRSAFRTRGFGGRWPLDSMVIAARGAAHLDHGRVAADAAAVVCPCLVAWALDDAIVQASIGEALAEAIDGATALVLPEGGHDFFRHHPRPVAAAIRDLEVR